MAPNSNPSQFSIRFLLVLTAEVAAGAAALRMESSVWSALVIDGLCVVFATTAVLGALKTGGRLRSFWVGTAIVLGFAAIGSIQQATSYWPFTQGKWATAGDAFFETRRYVWPVWCAAPVNGFFTLLLDWLAWPRQSDGRALENQDSK